MRALVIFSAAVILLALTGLGHATSLAYDVTQPAASGPPYPAQPILFDVFHLPDPIHVLAVQLFDASHPPSPVTPFPLTLRGSDAGVGRARPGRIEFLPTMPPAVFQPPDPIHFDVFFDLRPHPSAAGPLTLQPPSPIIPPNSERSFDVFFAVLNGGGTASHMAHFAIGAGQPLVFQNMQVGPPQSPAFHVTFDLALQQQPGAVPALQAAGGRAAGRGAVRPDAARELHTSAGARQWRAAAGGAGWAAGVASLAPTRGAPPRLGQWQGRPGKAASLQRAIH